MPKPTSPADTSIKVVIVTMDGHIASAVDRARARLLIELPGLKLSLHAASEWSSQPSSLESCKADIAEADIIVSTMLFMEDQVQAILPSLRARQPHCDAFVGCVATGDIIKLTHLGGLRMDGSKKGPLSLLKRLRGSSKKKDGKTAGAKQMAVLRKLPKLLRFIPGTAQDLRAYFLTMQYWLAGSDENIANMVRLLISRYAQDERRVLRDKVSVGAPRVYPDQGLYHPRMGKKKSDQITEDPDALPRLPGAHGRVGLLIMRSYVLAGDCAHYDAIIESLESKGLEVVPAFAAGLDARPAIEAFFMKDGLSQVDALLSVTGFSLVGGPAFNDARAAEEILARLDVPYLSAQALEFQSLEEWTASERGLLPVEATIMLAIPELDGATAPTVYAGRSQGDRSRDMQAIPDRVEAIAKRVDRMVRLRRSEVAKRKVGVVLFNFPPNGGATGTAAFLSVFESLLNTLRGLAEAGYTVEVPESVDALREAVLGGNSQELGTDARVHDRIPVDDHVRRETWLDEIEAQWGPAPGRQLTDGRSLFVLGARLGNVFVGIQPGFGYEGDPMRLLFEKGFAPTHAFSAFYRWLREDFEADAVLHFGTHGALEFMPGKQSGLSSACWPDRLIGDLPSVYLYAGNNPSEGTIAKRRAAATLVSHMTPPLAKAGLYKELLDLEGSTERWRGLPPDESAERERLEEAIETAARELDLMPVEKDWRGSDSVLEVIEALSSWKAALIPHGLHVVGAPMEPVVRREWLEAAADVRGEGVDPKLLDALLEGAPPPKGSDPELVTHLEHLDNALQSGRELPAILHALEGGFIRPAPGGDIARNPEVLPSGRNLHGFDPFRLPSRFAIEDGARQADRLLKRHMEMGNALPESVAMVLWGTDNLKTEGGPIGQVLALVGAEPRFDPYGRLCGAQLVDLETLGRPRIDVVVTLSGIFRDLLPLQTKLLAEAFWLAASAEEPEEMNFVRRNTLRFMEEKGCDFDTATLRVFSNADGAYGSNVNFLVDSGSWQDEDELAETYTRRKCFAYGRDGTPARQEELLQSALSLVQLSYQNLESVELGVTTIDHYFDTLGGLGRAVRRAKGDEIPVYIGDQTRGEGTIRTLGEQITLESRTRMLNPKWYEGMLAHGSEGVRQIEAHITNTMGWSATTGQVAPWVYKQLSQTFVLDPEMRERLAQLNPKASAKLANRLLEAHERSYWEPDAEMLDALRKAGDELEDRLEGVGDAA
ncbi:MAG: magnesium chelatase subunit H [Myxococcota bacterium]